MLARSLLLLTALLLLVAAVSSVLAPRELRSGRGAAALAAAAETRVPPAGPGDARDVTFAIPRRDTVTVKVGDIVHVVAAQDAEDVVEIADLGMDAPVSPGIPATFDVVTDRPGTFPVTLRYAGRRIATLKVEPAS